MQSAPRLAKQLAVVYTLLAVYGSLYPFTGWHNSGTPLTAFLLAGWPRYITAFDLVTNALAYVPLGFLWVAVWLPRLGAIGAVAVTLCLGGSLSLGLEMLQNLLPSRVPSQLDILCNLAGTFIGALAGARWANTLLDGGRLNALRQRIFHTGALADAGLVLLLLWLLTMLNPDSMLFGNGNLRRLFSVSVLAGYSAELYTRIEAISVASNTLAIGLMVSILAKRPVYVVALLTMTLALFIKGFAYLIMMSGSADFGWLTPGSLHGLSIGLLLWLVANTLPASWQKAFAAWSLLFATTLINLAPENPYLSNAWQTWNPGQFLNFHGLTRLLSEVWPFLALPWLMMVRTDNE